MDVVAPHKVRVPLWLGQAPGRSSSIILAPALSVLHPVERKSVLLRCPRTRDVSDLRTANATQSGSEGAASSPSIFNHHRRGLGSAIASTHWKDAMK